MEVDWAKHQLNGYLSDGQQILQRLEKGEVNRFFLERSLDLLTTYLSIPQNVPISPDLHTVMIKLARKLFQDVWPLGYWHQILQWWPKMMTIAQQIPDPTLRIKIIQQLSVIKNNQGEVAEALALVEPILDSPDFSRVSSFEQSGILHHLGVCYVRQGDYARATQTLTRCLTLARKDQHWELEAYALNQLGNIALFYGNFRKAHSSYKQSLAIFEKNGQGDDLACIAYQSLGRLLVLQREFGQAIPLLKKGLAIRRRWGEQEGTATNGVHLATAYLELNRLSEAEALLNESLSICKDIRYLRGLALCYLAFGRLETKSGYIPQAIFQYQQGLDVLQDTSLPPLELQILSNLLPQLLRTGRIWEFLSLLPRLLNNLRQQRLSPITLLRLLRQQIRQKMKIG